LYVGKPLNILAVAAVFLVAHLPCASPPSARAAIPGPILLAAVAWPLCAAWEWLVRVRTPEANVRVDLVLIWPVLAILSAWALFRALG
jgi:hypothetical protein